MDSRRNSLFDRDSWGISMKQRNTVVTLALLGVLALAAVAGGLLPAGNTVHAADPVFVSDTFLRSVDENTPPGVNIGDPISATDADEAGENALEFGNTLTYKLGGADAASFDIDASTGQLITKVPLDAEGDGPYSVTVTVDDGEDRLADSPCTTCRQTVSIRVMNVAGSEPPLAPHPPTVVSGADSEDTTDEDESLTTLKVVWHSPDNTGRPVIEGYEVEYKESTATAFTDLDPPHSGTDPIATITGLTADTSYDVRVRATNGEADATENWSLVGTGSTNKEGNSRPQSNDDTPATRRVDENTPAGENVGSPVTATDGDTTTLTYDLEGPHADLFSFDTRSGQIRTKAPLNHEDARCGYVEPADPATATTCTYRVTVTVIDGAGGSDATGVNILVEDRTEPPSAPGRPTVRATEESSTSLDVTWKEPENTGPAITSYLVQYRKGTESFSDDGVIITGATAKISDVDPTNDDAPWLSPDTSYEVRVRAINAERLTGGPWSASGSGRTNRGNHEPIFDDRPGTGAGSERNSDPAYTVSRTIDENPRSGQVVGRLFADDADNNTLTYKLVAFEDTDSARAEASKFTINERTGEIRTKAEETYNYEAITGTCTPLTESQVGTDRCYTVKVEVLDEKDEHGNDDKDEDADDSITVKIGVRDRDEKPAVPTVMVTSPDDNTTLEVFWDARNTGPPITGYDVQYRKGGGTFLNDNCDSEADDNCDQDSIGTDTTTTILALEEDTSYSVQVRAKNDEGTSAWSSQVTVKTNKDRVDPDQSNVPPTITPPDLAVDENTPSGRSVGAAVIASDDASTLLTYSMGGRDAALFTIASSTGQIRTRAALNHEDAACGYDSTDDTTTCTYTVRVKVDDRAGGSASIPVTITVNDLAEPPSKPGAPRVTATKDTGQSLDVTWNEPRNTGKPPITDYDIQYRKYKASNPDRWQDWPHGTDDAGNTEMSAEIDTILSDPDDDTSGMHLEPSTQYEVRVKAKNGEGDTADNWSSVGRGTTGKSNSRPSFDSSAAVVTLSVAENTRSGQSIGDAVSASDADSNTVRYSLEGPGADSFTIVSSSGQIRARALLDYESREFYSLTVKADDGQKRKNSVAAKSVTIAVTDVREPPPPPAAPTVAGIPGSTSSIRVTWAEPANTGPAITRYDVHYREVGNGPTRWDHFGADRGTIITGLKAGTRYEVQVRARSAEGSGEWSRWGSGSPNPDVANRNPTFSGASRSLSVAENTPPNTDVGAPIAATDRDGDALTYTLEGADSDSFDILSTSDGGQIRTSAELNHEEKSSYAVTVRVRDGRGGTDAVNVTIRVTDVDNEAPDTPFAPTVTAVSSSRLQVTWEMPANQGPPITDYDYRYREPGGSWTEVTNTTITGTAVTIEGLAASTSYDVEVLATNAEGSSDWSNPGIGSTNAPDANNPPVFTEGRNATRSVSASAPTGTSIGLPVAATDADSGDTLTYSLEGRDAALFDINDVTGQILTKSGVTLIAGETYTVTVAADDSVDIARISVTIEATAAPPNNAPVFSEGSSTTRTVSASAPAGTSIGAPVTATDADSGTTLTYSLEGAAAASFGINTANGQLLTVAGVTLTPNTYTVEVVASDGSVSSRITVTIAVTANRPPVFSEGATTTRSVREDAASGASVGNPVTATDADAGTTLTYTLGGADAASFTIVAASGQIRTGVALDYETKASYTVTVTANDGTVDSAPITVTINVTQVVAAVFDCSRGAVADQSNTGLVSDCEALLAARNRLEGNARLNWSDVAPIANWDGVYLRGTPERVTMLILRSWGLDGTVPAELGQLGRLTQLNLHSNNLSGSIPDEIGDLTNLQKLLLHNNSLSGDFPDLRRLRNLTHLWLSGADHSVGSGGGVPTWLNGLTDLVELNLWGNELGGTIPTLSGLTSLKLLKLQNNSLTGGIPTWFGNMNTLGGLYIHNNDLTGSIPSELGRLTTLRRPVDRQERLDRDDPCSVGQHVQSRDPEPAYEQAEWDHPDAAGKPEQAAALRTP